jgi:3-hydroxyisobutyrate dehydrogenase-like beta-hydroxyacid dehydrogenase
MTTKTYQIAFIGLGVMGGPMAGHLATRGHQVTVFNRTRAKAEAWAERYAGQVADSPAAAAQNADFVISCVGNDDDLRAITVGPAGAFSQMEAGAIFIDHTTASAEIARELAEIAHSKGLHCLDAPVSGGQAGAENGVLTIMVGGEQSVFDRSVPVLDCYARAVTLIGAAGCGQLAKMVNQITITGLLQSLAEAIHFGQQAGLDMDLVLDVISKGAAQSWQMENRGHTMVAGEFEFGFAVDWMRKDLGLCLAEARRNGSALPVAAMVDQFYAEVQNLGGQRWDTSSLITRLRQFKS